ncbi:MAG: efflux RND transporter periplasmic adaptor subunit [Flavicella sp.]
MRKLIISFVAILFVIVSYFVKNSLAAKKVQKKQKVEKIVKTVFTEQVMNTSLPIVIRESGSLVAKHKVALFAEAQGVLEVPNDDFRVGVTASKGSVLLQINSDDDTANLLAQKSNFQNAIAVILPDLRMDHPKSFPAWEAYFKNFDISSSLQELPTPLNETEKYFVIAKGIYKNYYAIKNLEASLERYTIRAPFNGVLSEALVTNGSLIRPGQKLGEFIGKEIYELFLSVNANLVNSLAVGKEVHIYSLNSEKSWTGKVVRFNNKIDQKTQTVQVYVEVRGKDLREGMYVDASVTANRIDNAYEIPQNILIAKKAVYVYEDGFLKLQPVVPVYFNENTVLVKGLKNGQLLVNRPVSGAFEGMQVKLFDKN